MLYHFGSKLANLNMTLSGIVNKSHHYWANGRINYSIKVFVALSGVTGLAWYRGTGETITPMVLGIIAAALAQTDDSFWGRVKGLVMTLICFLLASLSIELLFNYHWLFAVGLFCSTFGFTMLGAMGAPFGSMSFASLLLAVYTMLGASVTTNLWTQPALLLAGASWYGVVSLAWHILWPNQPVQQSLATVFRALADYFVSKSQLFDPARKPNSLALAHTNTRVVTALNQAKISLLQRVRRHAHIREQPLLRTYFLAQDIHERVSSSHYRYQDLANCFCRSDILFRFQKMLSVQAEECKAIARALALGRAYVHRSEGVSTLNEIKQSLNYLEAQNNLSWRPLLNQLDYLLKNLATVDMQLAAVGRKRSDTQQRKEDTELADAAPKGIKGHLLCIWRECRLSSPLFRHGLRLAIALTLGYGLIQWLQLQPGYWVLLTTLFVCQPSYSATRQKLIQRVAGTLLGLGLGIPLLYLFPGYEGQLVLMVISGTLFFAFRTVRYDLATLFITLLVLFCFNQQGMGFAVVMPRLGDTLLGCLLAVAAVMCILPDWESRRLNQNMAATIAKLRVYLAQVIKQYETGKQDTLEYRLARRNAHNMDARLNTTIMNMLAEPNRYQRAKNESFRFLTLTHTLLSYISTLGAHRKQLTEVELQAIQEPYELIDQHLSTLEKRLTEPTSEPKSPTDTQAKSETPSSNNCPHTGLLLQQFQLILQLMPPMHALATDITQQMSKRPKNKGRAQ